ncbi:GNAT family N-acetyltransferase [Streptomyces rochei]|uniref:GNAT family N-acetyltransferase n=1 Tax=Streptomyces rochei TaxID=1928 RepID=UPI003681C20A
MIELRVLTPDDWAVWRELRLAALTEAPYAFGAKLADWQNEGDTTERWRSRLGIPGSRNFVALRQGKPIGMVTGVRPPGSDTVELMSLWVSEEARGQGVGDRLVRAVEEWAAEGGARLLQLAVMPDNEHALNLYRRRGLTETGCLGDEQGEGQKELIMTKPLPAA